MAKRRMSALLLCASGIVHCFAISGTAAEAQKSTTTSSPAPHRPIAGIIETATLYPGGFKLKAKLDTGARTSSLGVTSYRVFAQGGRDMVEFSVRRADGTAETLVRPLARISFVKERGRESSSRPVILMTICVGNLVRQTEVNLQNRENFNYTLLIGRRYLAGAYAVDPARRNILRTDCPAAKDISK